MPAVAATIAVVPVPLTRPVRLVAPVPPLATETVPVTLDAVPVVFWFRVGNVQLVRVPEDGVPSAPPSTNTVFPLALTTPLPLGRRFRSALVSTDLASRVGVIPVPEKIANFPVPLGTIVNETFVSDPTT